MVKNLSNYQFAFHMEDKQIIIAFGIVLRETREIKGLTQEKLAYNIKSHPTHISRLENGHKQPTLTTIYKLAAALSINPIELLQLLQTKLESK